MKKIGYDIGIGAAHDVVPFEEACVRGSYPSHNAEYCKVLKQTLHDLGIKKVVDYGCGNLQSYKGHIDWTREPFEYVGYDAHHGCVAELKKRYPTLTFKESVLREIPGDGDVLIIKDVLIHWFDEDIKWFFDNVFDNFEYVCYMHSTTNQGYGAKDHRHAPHEKYNMDLQEEHFYGCRYVPIELVPSENVTCSQNIMNDSMKTFILLKRR